MYDSLRYLVVDDDELDRLAVLNETSKYPFLQRTAVCSNAEEAVATLISINLISFFRILKCPVPAGWR